MPARLFFRTKKLLKHFSKAFLLSAFLLVAVLGNILPASAQAKKQPQQDETYKEFYTLFDPQGGEASLSLSQNTWKIPPAETHANDLLFTFKGGFDFSKNTLKEWFWDHVADFYTGGIDNRPKKDLFVVRLCKATADGKPDEKIDGQDDCIFADPPYQWQCNTTNGECLKTIAHRVMGSEDAISSFSVNFGQLEFHERGDTTNLAAKTNPTITPGTNYVADLWYCAKPSAINPEITKDYASTQTVNNYLRNFENLCGSDHNAYFMIARTEPFTAPATAQAAQDANQTGDQAQQSEISTQNGEILPTCGWFSFSGTFTGCIAQGVYYIIYRPVAWFAGIMGSLFDFFLGYSISDESYRMDFVVTGWRIVRDISNIFFIVILIWAGLLAVFDSEKTSLKNVVVAVIVNALLINFSLFGTRVIVDLSNIVTRVFYSNVEVCEGKCVDADNNGTPDNLKQGAAGKYKPLSEKIVAAFNPQTLFSPKYLSPSNSLPQKNASNSSLFGVQNAQDANVTDQKGTSTYAALFIVVSLFGAVILFAIAVMFWKTAFLFLGRILGIYVVMIFSPFAVLTRGNVPIFGNIQSLKWSDWWNELFNYAMLAPIFVFFLYVVYMFIDADWMKFTQIGDGSFFEKVLAVGIPMLFIFFLVKKGVDIAKKYAGTIGNMVQNFVNNTVGGVGGLIGGGVGLAAGGVGLVGRNVVGRGLSLAGRIGTGRDKEGKRISLASRLASNADTNRFARMGNNFLKWSKTSSWDPRNISAKVAGKEYTALGTFNKGVTLLGKPIGEAGPKDNISGKVGMGKDAGKGGIKEIDKKRVEAKKKELTSRINLDHLSDSDAKAAWQAHVEKKSAELARTDADHEYAMKNSADYAKLDEDIKNKNKNELGPVVNQINDIYKKLADPTTSSTERDSLKEELRAKKTEFKDITGEIKKLKGQQSAALEKFKKDNPTYEGTDAYKEQFAKSQAKKRGEVDKYGKIENGKALTAAMRAEYAEDLRKSSMWMWDGKTRLDSRMILGGGAAGNLFAGGLGLGIGAGWMAPFAAALGSYVQSQADIMDQATKEIIGATKKSQGKGTKKAKLEGHRNALKAELKKHLEKVDKDMKDIDEALAREDDYIDRALATRRVQMEEELKGLKKALDTAHTEYEAEADPTKKEALKKKRDNAEIELAVKKQERDRLSNLRNDLERADDALDRYTTKEAENEEKAKKKADEGKAGGDKPKEGNK